MDGVSLCLFFWFGSLVLGLVEGFNGMEDGFKLYHFRYMPSILALIIRSVYPLQCCTGRRVATTHFANNRKVYMACLMAILLL
jgi:hypothetical protein